MWCLPACYDYLELNTEIVSPSCLHAAFVRIPAVLYEAVTIAQHLDVQQSVGNGSLALCHAACCLHTDGLPDHELSLASKDRLE